jgi:hypothetical protein
MYYVCVYVCVCVMLVTSDRELPCRAFQSGRAEQKQIDFNPSQYHVQVRIRVLSRNDADRNTRKAKVRIETLDSSRQPIVVVIVPNHAPLAKVNTLSYLFAVQSTGKPSMYRRLYRHASPHACRSQRVRIEGPPPVYT